MAIACTLTSPMVLWSLGLSPRWTLEVHLIAFGLALRLLVMAAALSRRARDAVWVGIFGGSLSSIFAQILLHTPHDNANVAAVFSTYGPLGAGLYRLDELTTWWPYALSVVDALFYGALAFFAFRYVTRLQPWATRRASRG